MPEAPPSENLRQLEHLAPIVFAFVLRYLSWPQALGLALFALIYGLFVSHRLWTGTRRPREAHLFFSPGKVAYAVGILGLLLVFPSEKYVVAAVWANLSVGDAASNLIGRNFGRGTLPWNPRKTWLGCAAAFACSAPAAYILIMWNGLPPGQSSAEARALFYAIGVSLVCSLVETLPLPVDDNLTICIAGGAAFALLTRVSWPGHLDWTALTVGFSVSMAAAIVAWLLKTVSGSGVVWGVLLGSLVYLALGGRGFILLGTFFVVGSLFSKIGYHKKDEAGLAQPNRGRRTGRNVWGKGFAALLAALASIFLDNPAPALIAFVAALGASLCDTTATELGQLLGKHPVSLSTLRPVPRGTPGAVSLAGSICGLLAAVLIAFMGYWFQFVTAWNAVWVVLASVIAAHLEGFLAGRRKGERPSGPLMNAFHTTIAMLIALLLAGIKS